MKQLSTGDVARMTGFSMQHVIRMIDSGELRGFRMPGSRFRRVYLDDLVAFAKEHGLRLEGIEEEAGAK